MSTVYGSADIENIHYIQNDTLWGRIRSHFSHHEHRKRTFIAWLVVLSIVSVFLLSFFYSTDVFLSQPGEEPSYCESDRSFLVALLLSIFTGPLGVDRFYLGYVFLGILKLITAGFGGIWWVIDIILIAVDALPDSNGCRLE